MLSIEFLSTKPCYSTWEHVHRFRKSFHGRLGVSTFTYWSSCFLEASFMGLKKRKFEGVRSGLYGERDDVARLCDLILLPLNSKIIFIFKTEWLTNLQWNALNIFFWAAPTLCSFVKFVMTLEYRFSYTFEPRDYTAMTHQKNDSPASCNEITSLFGLLHSNSWPVTNHGFAALWLTLTLLTKNVTVLT